MEDSLLKVGRLSETDEEQLDQGPQGILLKVESQTKPNRDRLKVTELLLYATAQADSTLESPRTLTPPRSSSPDLMSEDGQSQQLFLLRALPLSSDLRSPSSLPPSKPTEDQPETLARFFPSLDSNHPGHQESQGPDSLFVDATKQQRWVRKHGGRSVAKIMAGADVSRMRSERPKEPEWLAPRKSRSKIAPTLARSQSGELLGTERQRSKSRGGPSTKHRSSLRRVASISRQSSEVAASAMPSSTEQQNKDALSRLVMAGMRIYGLQQRKRADSSAVSSEGPSKDTILPGQETNEYKLIYHRTFNATTFVFRRQIRSVILSQEILRDTVDRLLAMFCIDPFAEGVSGSQESGAGDLIQHTFDLPSDPALVSDAEPVEGCRVDGRMVDGGGHDHDSRA